jgi:cyclic-di-GMP-binding protein
MALSLSVPATTQALPKGIETKPKQAKVWVESLPLTKMVETTRVLLEHIMTLNRSKMSADERFELLETYRPVLHTLLEELEHVFAYSTLPLPPKQREAFELGRTLATEAAVAYKQLIIDKTGKLIGFGNKKSLPLPLHRAMTYTGRVLTQSFKTYYPAPPGAWRDLHQLYAFAEEQGLLAEIVEPESKASLLDVYSEPIMLSLADPYRLMYREADKVLELLSQNRGTVSLTGQRPESLDPTKVFIVALDSDRSPRLMSIAIKDPPGQVLRLLDLTKLVEKMKQRVQAMTNNHEAYNRSKASHDTGDLMARLIRLWGDPPKRQFRRNPSDTGVVLCSGIKAIAHFAMLAMREDHSAQAAAIQDGSTMPLLKIPDDPVSKAMGVEEWTVLNQSANGLRLHRESGGNVGVTVGEAIGVRFAGGQAWNVGVVRWLNVLENNDIEFGVELIAPSAQPIEIEPTISSSSKVQPALKLPSMLAEGESEALLTYPDTFSDLREFELNDGQERSFIRATGLIEKTSRFEIFQFNPS